MSQKTPRNKEKRSRSPSNETNNVSNNQIPALGDNVVAFFKKCVASRVVCVYLYTCLASDF